MMVASGMLIFAALLWLLMIAGGIYLLITSKRRPAGTGPYCGHCGYNLTAATGNRCPECGKLFIEAGVGTTASGRGRKFAGVSLLVLGALPMICGSLSMLTYLRAARSRQQVVATMQQQQIAAGAATPVPAGTQYYEALLTSLTPVVDTPTSVRGQPGRMLKYSPDGRRMSIIIATNQDIAAAAKKDPTLPDRAQAYQTGFTRGLGARPEDLPDPPPEDIAAKHHPDYHRGYRNGRAAAKRLAAPQEG